jgi:hypothetical protein
MCSSSPMRFACEASVVCRQQLVLRASSHTVHLFLCQTCGPPFTLYGYCCFIFRRSASDRRIGTGRVSHRMCYEGGSVSSKEEIASVYFSASSLLTAIAASLTRLTPVERPFRFVLVFADDTRAQRQLLHTGYHEKV